MDIISSAPTTDDKAIEDYFKEQLAPFLLNSVLLFINGTAHKFREVEFYMTNDAHPDPYTHCDVLQQQNAIWYFHKTGTGYKGGSYKGLDIALGQGKASPGGVLIRSIENVETGDIICGPSLCVDHILESCGAENIASFVLSVLKKDLSVLNTNSLLHIKLMDEPEKNRVYFSPRVGLHMTKNVSDDLQIKYCFRLYRALTTPSTISKGRTLIVSTLLSENVPVKQISTITGVKEATVTKYKSLYEEGKSKNVQNFMKSLTEVQLCGALGCVFNLNAPKEAKVASSEKEKKKETEDSEEEEEESKDEEDNESQSESAEEDLSGLQLKLSKLKVTELKEKLKENKLAVGGTKGVLIERLLNCKTFVESHKKK